MERIYGLLKSNMHDHYVEAGWNWKEAEKRRELNHRCAQFLVAWSGVADDKSNDALPAVFQEVGTGESSPGEQNVMSTHPVPEDGTCPIGNQNARSDARRLAGFCHFRFAWDADDNDDGSGAGGTEDVLYVYELQVAPWARSRGLGRRMMQAVEVCIGDLRRQAGNVHPDLPLTYFAIFPYGMMYSATLPVVRYVLSS